MILGNGESYDMIWSNHCQYIQYARSWKGPLYKALDGGFLMLPPTSIRLGVHLEISSSHALVSRPGLQLPYVWGQGLAWRGSTWVWRDAESPCGGRWKLFGATLPLRVEINIYHIVVFVHLISLAYPASCISDHLLPLVFTLFISHLSPLFL